MSNRVPDEVLQAVSKSIAGMPADTVFVPLPDGRLLAVPKDHLLATRAIMLAEADRLLYETLNAGTSTPRDAAFEEILGERMLAKLAAHAAYREAWERVQAEAAK